MVAAVICLMVFSTPGWSQTTTFTDADGTDSLITNPLNWDNGLPTNGVAGTLGIDAQFGGSLSGYHITFTNGTLSRTSLGPFSLGSNTTFIINGSSASVSGNCQGIYIDSTAQLTFEQGTLNAPGNSDSDVHGAFVMNGGAFDVSRRLSPRGGGTIAINGGTVSCPGELGGSNLDSGDIFLNGGVLTFDSLCFGHSGINVFFGGSTEGTLTIQNFFGFRHQPNYIDIEFATGSKMSFTVTDPVESGGSGDGKIGWWDVGDETGKEWAEALWSNGRLTFDGQDYTTLGDWATVTNANGLGNDYRFDFDSNTDTLSLAYEPPPAGTVLIVQ